MTISELTGLLGWCTLLNFGMLITAAIVLALGRQPVAKIQARFWGLQQHEIEAAYLNYLANYKILVFIFNLVPYLALRIMGY